MKISEWLGSASEQLRDSGIESAALEAQVLAAHAHGTDRVWILSHPDELINAEANELLHRRLSCEPLAYILGYREFFGRRFEVNGDVLIPRQETELLVERAISAIENRPIRVLDWGTGSGCIAITIALECKTASVTACDISDAALTVAQRNAHDLMASVENVLSDGFKSLTDRKFDLIVANPPYVAVQDFLPAEVEQFEPAVALFSQEDGLAIYHRIAEEAPRHLNENGLLMVEIGAGQAKAVEQVFSLAGWRLLNQFTDLAGHERVLEFALP